MNAAELFVSAKDRIAKNRTAEFEMTFTHEDGRPLAGAEVSITLIRHEFRFGCNAFLIHRIEDGRLQGAYNDRFGELLNYATLPFYWGGYEPLPGETNREALEAMAQWCADNHIAVKGHPLVWHEVYPQWGSEFPDDEIIRRQERRVREIVSHFKGAIDTWDVVNEANASERFDNAVGRWMKKDGPVECVLRALQRAHEANPDAQLLYNDFDVTERNEKLIEALIERQAPLAAIGIQSHMHKGGWPLEKVWDVCERFGRFGLPIHFTETTVLSGPLKAKDDNDWHRRRTDWKTAPQGEEAQADYGEKFYTLLFSHPAVEAVTWWDFSDFRAWQGAPAGLVRSDMTPKPLYARLMRLIHGKWCTRGKLTTDADGRARVTGFFGDHEVDVCLPSGQTAIGTFTAAKSGPREVDVVLA